MSDHEKRELAGAYRPSEHEARIGAGWEASGAFHADPSRVLSGGRGAYCIVIPPPNVTAALHLGHALNNTLQDVLARAHRMKGFETLWLPGADHAGIATQTVVEKRLLAEEGKRRTEYTREEFVSRVRAWKDEYEGRIRDQLRAMGCSCDWARWRFTMDETCARAVREAFFRLFAEGLIYRGKRLVNWDPATQTALADDEVEMREVEGAFYYLRYPLCDADGHAASVEIDGETVDALTVATTRPETYLGDTAVAVNPRDPRAPALRGLRVRLPFVGRVIPIVEDDYVVMPAADPEAPGVDPKARFATGFLKVTPAHDPNDWEIGRRHDLPVVNVMGPDGAIASGLGWDDVGDAGRFVGLSREDARKAVVEAFRVEGLLEGVRAHRHSVGHSYRSHVAVEPWLSDQWYVRVSDDRLVGYAQRALAGEQRESVGHRPKKGVESDGALRFTPARYARTYEGWHDNLRDWCISRQLWWGHRIPVWRRAVPDDQTVEGSELYAGAYALSMRPEYKDRMCVRAYDLKTGKKLWMNESLDSNYKPDNAFELFICLRDGENDLELAQLIENEFGVAQDPDVLDTWFSSALWPLSTMGWPERTDLLGAFNPTSALCTAREIITLWVSRMAMFNRFFLAEGGEPGPVPFRDVFIHAMIQDGEGRKMSKSLGNGVDPLDIIETHGADAMRFTLCSMATHTQDVRMPVERDERTGRNTSPKFDLGRNFANKLWNASRFAITNLDAAEGEERGGRSLVERWMLSRLAGALAEIDARIEGYEFAGYAQQVYDLLWRDFCDWFLEGIKPTVRGSATQRSTLRASLGCILRVLHPICPFVTEAIHERLRQTRADECAGVELPDSELLCVAAWPRVDASLRDEAVEARFERLRALVNAVREARSAQGVPPKRRIALHVPAGSELAGEVREAGGLVETLAGLSRVTTEEASGASSVLTFDAMELRLSELHDAVDSGAERARLGARVEELEKSIRALEGRLANPGYTEKAPAHLVQQTRDQLAAARAERDAAASAMGGLR